MRRAWLIAFTAAFCAAEFVATLALANPASMAMSKRRPATPESKSSIWPWSKTATPGPTPPAVVGRPTESISATRHPIQYLKATAAKIPVGSKGKSASAQRVAMQPATTKVDSISLSTPTGPPSPEFFIFAAQVCERQGDLPQARSNLQRALTMWPGHVEVLRAAARMEDRQGNLPLAENLYGQAVTSNPQHAGALNDLGLCLARQGKLEPSLQTLEQAVQLQPTKALYRNNAATVLVEMHQDQRALAHLAAVHGAADANYNLGQLLVARSRPAEAAPYFEAALQQNPNMQAAQDALAILQGSQVVVSMPAGATAPVIPDAQVQPGPQVEPQQGWPTAPQANDPATARVPGTNATGRATPQYLPPVANRPATAFVR
jgi:tetratricopeptide (TPR) repeat protein